MNILMVLMDDMGQRDLGCYGSTFYETPAVDQLAREGMLFTDAYAACPVCSPTRASIMTGRYPARIGLTDYLVGRRRGKLLPAEYVEHLPLEEVTVAECLREAGFVSASIGKWHLGPEPYYPEHQGFDVNIGGCHLGHPPSYFWPYGDSSVRVPITPGQPDEYLTDRLTDETIRFIRRNASRPFFVYLSHYAVHNPQQSRDHWTRHFTEKLRHMPQDAGPEFEDWRGRRVRVKQNQPVYAGMIASADEGLARIVAELKSLGLYDKTVIVFTSDNGGLSTSEGTPTSNRPLAGGKGWLHEGGIRVPLIVRWPGVTRPGAVTHEPVISNDLFPTMLSMAGMSQRPELHCDGLDITSILRNEQSAPQRDLYWHYPHYSNQGCPPSGAIREGRLKLIENFEDGTCELYDLAADPGETDDLSVRRPEDTRRLRDKLATWRKEVGARMPRPDAEAIEGHPAETP
ncbi:MAG: sulfatase [Chthonomonadales bacterium]|nr:sulfatase [Chthonomonadales bacterium]